MDQYPGKTHLEIDVSYYNSLDIQSFALMLKDPSYCYKFYWLEAIVHLISTGVSETLCVRIDVSEVKTFLW